MVLRDYPDFVDSDLFLVAVPEYNPLVLHGFDLIASWKVYRIPEFCRYVP